MNDTFVSKAIGIVVAVIVVAVVLVPIVNAAAGGSGGGGSGETPTYTNTGEYYYRTATADSEDMLVYYGEYDFVESETWSAYIGLNDTEIFSISGVPIWSDAEQVPHEYDVFFPFCQIELNGGIATAAVLGKYEYDVSDEGTHNYMYRMMIVAFMPNSSQSQLSMREMFFFDPQDEAEPLPVGLAAAQGLKTYIAPDGDYVWAEKPTVTDSTEIAFIYDYSDYIYVTESVTFDYGYVGPVNGLKNVHNYNYDGHWMSTSASDEGDSYNATLTLSTTPLAGAERIESITMDVDWDTSTEQSSLFTATKMLVPVTVGNEPSTEYATGNNPDTWMKMAYGEDSTFSITLDYEETVSDDWDPIAYAYFNVQSNGTMTAPVDDLRDALYEADQSIGQDDGLAYGIVYSGTIIPLVAWEDAETYRMIMVDLSQGYFSFEVYDKLDDGYYDSNKLGSSVTGIESNGTTLTVHFESDEDIVFDMTDLAPLKVYYADAKGGYGVYHASDILDTDGTVKASLYRTSETIHQFYLNAGAGAVSKAYIDGRQVGMYDTSVSIEIKETVIEGKVSFEGWHANIHYQNNDTSEEEDIFASSFILPLHADNGSSGGGGSGDLGVSGTLLKAVPVFVIIGLLMGVVTMFFQTRYGL